MSSAARVWIGVMEADQHGEIRFRADDAAEYAALVSDLDGYEVEQVLRKKRSTRSLRQNRWFWSFMKPLAEHLGYEVEELKLVGLIAVFGTHAVMGYTVPVHAHTSELNTEEFADLCAWFVQKAAEIDFLILTPDEFKREKKQHQRRGAGDHAGRKASRRLAPSGDRCGLDSTELSTAPEVP